MERPPSPPFQLRVETQPGFSPFPPPPTWQSDSHRVNDITVHAHTRPPTRTSGTLGFPVVTFHDVAQNAAICFSAFFSFCRTSSMMHLDSAKSHYHLTAPGHEPEEPECGRAISMQISDMANGVLHVLDRFNLTRVIAFGVGIGGTIMLRAAALRPKAFAGLVLISPLFQPASLWERTTMSLDCFFARNITLGVSKHVKEKLLCRWLSSETQESNDTLTNELEESIDRLNATNVVRFVAEDSNRQSMENIIKDVKSKLLIITDVADSGSLVFNEYPEIVAQAISLFLQGFPGYC